MWSVVACHVVSLGAPLLDNFIDHRSCICFLVTFVDTRGTTPNRIRHIPLRGQVRVSEAKGRPTLHVVFLSTGIN